MNALRVETCMLYMYFKETSLISHASLESSNKESINQLLLLDNLWLFLFYRVRKILNLRVFDNDEGKRWAHSVKDKQYEILCVSQVRFY